MRYHPVNKVLTWAQLIAAPTGVIVPVPSGSIWMTPFSYRTGASRRGGAWFTFECGPTALGPFFPLYHGVGVCPELGFDGTRCCVEIPLGGMDYLRVILRLPTYSAFANEVEVALAMTFMTNSAMPSDAFPAAVLSAGGSYISPKDEILPLGRSKYPNAITAYEGSSTYIQYQNGMPAYAIPPLMSGVGVIFGPGYNFDIAPGVSPYPYSGGGGGGIYTIAAHTSMPPVAYLLCDDATGFSGLTFDSVSEPSEGGANWTSMAFRGLSVLDGSNRVPATHFSFGVDETTAATWLAAGGVSWLVGIVSYFPLPTTVG